ncbi:MAG TPA: GNAT family N-acetyltransferase [Candidatus Limnocylindrales bacterium]|jgi:mycothiol synthase|nr:GNAT family N-acetyltransferase [Candidatus Limnocylindrales bacterium]
MTSRETMGLNGLVVDDAPAIPGLRFRRFDAEQDYELLAGLIGTANLADGIDELPDATTIRAEHEHTAGFDPRLDTIFAEVDGRLVAYGEVSRTVRTGRAVYTTSGTVHPEWRRRGLGRAILRHNERRLREMATGHEEPGGRILNSWIHDQEAGTRQLLKAEGYYPVRSGFAMRRPTLDDLPEARLPNGLEIRPVLAEDHRAIYDADTEAFLDHFEARERTDEDFVAMFAAPYLDTSLWRVAWAGDQVAGSVMPTIWAPENEKLGVRRAWLEHISVRRPWRRRGLARALILSALEGLRERGVDEAMLGVDAENLTGALALYESLGFVVQDRGSTWRKAW